MGGDAVMMETNDILFLDKRSRKYTDKKIIPLIRAKKGRNLFDTTNYVSGYSLDSAGKLFVMAAQGTTDFLPVSVSTVYTVGCSYGYQSSSCFYDAQKHFISRNTGGSGYSVTFTTPANAAYIRVCFRLVDINTMQLVQGSAVLVPYEPFQYRFDPSCIIEPIPAAKLDTSLLTGVASKNLFDKSTAIAGKYIINTTGNLGTNATYAASDYIPVSPETAYVISGTGTYCEQFAFYDANKVYISGNAGGALNITKGFSFVTPANTAYIRVSLKTTNIDVYQIELGNVVTEYVPYGSKLARVSVAGLRPKNIFVVAKSDGDYATITEAVAAVRDSADNPITLIIAPGIYIEKVSLVGRYISLVGVNRATCIIRYDDGNYGNYPIDAWTYNHLANLTIISTHDNGQPIAEKPAYAVHLDYNSGTYTSKNTCRIDNCTLISYQHAAVGIGLQNLQTVEITNCELITRSTSYNGGALYCHNKQADGATGQRLIVKNCIVKSLQGDALVIEDANHRTGGGGGDAQDTIVTFYNNMFYSDVKGKVCARFDTPTERLSGYISLGPDSFGNNIAAINA
jgi:hypothetical protein